MSPIWNPEFFGNMIMVNGNTWPFQTVEQRRYRLRFLNGCQSRFLILDFSNIPGVEVWQIGNEGGFLAAPVNLTADNGNRLLMGLAERADLIVDFTNVPVGNYVLANVGPDEPFGGGEPDEDFDTADPDSTGQIMQFRVVPAVAADPTTPPQFLVLPTITRLTGGTTRPLALLEKASDVHRRARRGAAGHRRRNGDRGREEVDGPGHREPRGRRHRGLGVLQRDRRRPPDAHPRGRLPGRQPPSTSSSMRNGEVIQPIQLTGNPTPPEAWENGWKDTVIAYPGQVTRLRLRFTNPGQFVWHCHIVEHEDNEMMRPYRIGHAQPGQPT